MSRITKGDLVLIQRSDRTKPVTGTVISKPKEKPFQMSPRVVSMVVVVDVLVDGEVWIDVNINSLIKIEN